MKYFTPQMWLGFNSPHSKKALRSWDGRLRAYRQNLRKLLPRLNPPARRFFRDALILHDGTLMRMEVGDRIGNTLVRAVRRDTNPRRAAVRLFVLTDRKNQHQYILEYDDIEVIALDFPGKITLFPTGMSDFGNWGYDELTSPGKGIFRHEILFSSGATIGIECKRISVHRKPMK